MVLIQPGAVRRSKIGFPDIAHTSTEGCVQNDLLGSLADVVHTVIDAGSVLILYT